jgi:hypothetical protein
MRIAGSVNRQRLIAAVVCLALIPLGTEVDALVALGLAAAVAAAPIAYEAIRFSETRHRVRHQHAGGS